MNEDKIRCDLCKNGIFYELFGEYKCSEMQRIVYEMNYIDENRSISCTYFLKGAPKISKETVEDLTE